MNKIIFIDIAGTGTNPDKCAIYRLGGIVTYDGVEQERFEIRVRPYPNARISEQSLWIGGETRSSLVRYPKEEDALKSFIEILDRHIEVHNPNDKAYLAGFNASGLDIPFLRGLFLRNGNNSFRHYFYVQILDVMTMSALYLMNKRPYMQDFHLETAAKHMGISCPYGESYDSIQNAATSLRIYRKLTEEFGIGKCWETTQTEKVTRNF